MLDPDEMKENPEPWFYYYGSWSGSRSRPKSKLFIKDFKKF